MAQGGDMKLERFKKAVGVMRESGMTLADIARELGMYGPSSVSRGTSGKYGVPSLTAVLLAERVAKEIEND